jgi:hypothetical protein
MRLFMRMGMMNDNKSTNKHMMAEWHFSGSASGGFVVRFEFGTNTNGFMSTFA